MREEMRPQRLGEPLPRSVAVFRALQLGDLLCAVPAFRALRAALPDARMVLIGLPWATAFVERFSRYLDAFIEFPGYPGLPEVPAQFDRIPHFLRSAQGEQFDCAIQMHGSGAIVNPVTVLMGAKINAGFYREGDYCPDEYRFMPYPEQFPEIWRPLKLLQFLGVPLRGDELEFPLFSEDHRHLGALEETHALKKGEYICIHPGARLKSRRWLPERFALVGDAMAELGFTVVLTGSADEAELVDYVSNSMRLEHINLAGRTSLGALGALLKDARLLVANDTGVSHIAAALRVPSVVVTTGSDPFRWAPLDHLLHRAVYYPIKCRPCNYPVCPIGQPCAKNLSASTVISQGKHLVNARYSYAV